MDGWREGGGGKCVKTKEISFISLFAKLVGCKNGKQSGRAHAVADILPKIASLSNLEQRAGVNDLELGTEPIYTRIRAYVCARKMKKAEGVAGRGGAGRGATRMCTRIVYEKKNKKYITNRWCGGSGTFQAPHAALPHQPSKSFETCVLFSFRLGKFDG